MLLWTLLSATLVFVAGIGALRAAVLQESYFLLAGGMLLLGTGLGLLLRSDGTRPSRYGSAPE